MRVTVPHAFPVQLRHPPGQNITAVPGPPHSDRHAAYLVLNSLEGNQGKVPHSINTQVMLEPKGGETAGAFSRARVSGHTASQSGSPSLL